MKKICLLLILLLGLLILNSCSKANYQAASGESNNKVPNSFGIAKGQTPPDFIINTIDGKELKLSDFKDDKPLLLYFWASWCPYCKQDLEIVRNIYPKYADKVAFLAVDLDLNENANLIRKYKDMLGLQGIDFAQGNDEILSRYSVVHTTTKYAIGKSGTIIYKGSGVFSDEQWETLLNGLAVSD